MSKIYEALQRAELESASRASTSSPGQASQATNHAVPGPTPIAVPPPPSAPPPPAATLPMVPPSAIPAASTASNPTTIEDLPQAGISGISPSSADPADRTRRLWSPSIHQLPALLERGAGVEQFRSLRSRLQQFRDLNPLKSILIASGHPQEGKSFIAANLAISLARHKASRVLLIDGDMRRPSLHKTLGAPEGPGLTEYLAETAPFGDILQRPSRNVDGRPLPPGLDSLSFIPGGRASDRAADLSGNHRFDRLIAEAEPHFDWIVVDSSPVNFVSDGVNLARACDGVLLIARGGITDYHSAQRALAELKAVTVLGVVLNAVQDMTVATGYYGYDGYDKIDT